LGRYTAVDKGAVMPVTKRKRRSKLRQMLDAIDKALSTSASPNGRNIRENIKNKKRKTRKSKRTKSSSKSNSKKEDRPIDF